MLKELRVASMYFKVTSVVLGNCLC